MKTISRLHNFFDGNVQYPFADVGDKELMHISEITRENRRLYKYTCPNCKKDLLPRLGDKKAHCYAHRPGENCELDRYIHTTAERLLKEKWDRDEPFEIKMKVRSECKERAKCPFNKIHSQSCITEEEKTFNLKKQYSKCIVEKKYGEFVPDLCLIDETGKHKPIFIEIWSKHKNSEKKAQSDHRIIEIHIKTREELEELTKHPITESETVTFSHFKVKEKSPTREDCPSLMRYTLYSGTFKSHIEDQFVFSESNKAKHHAKSIFEVVCSQNDIQKRHFQNYCNAIAIDRGYNIRLCYLCKFYGTDIKDNELKEDAVTYGCKRVIETHGIIECKPEDAINCQHFKLKDKTLTDIKAKYANINRYIWFKDKDNTESEEYIPRKDPSFEFDDNDKPSWIHFE